jgi:hypothetical protein
LAAAISQKQCRSSPSTGHLRRNGQAKPCRMPSPPTMWCTRCLIALSVRRTSCKPRALEDPREASSFLAITRNGRAGCLGTISGAFVHKRARSYRGNASPAPIVDSTTRRVIDVSIWELCATERSCFVWQWQLSKFQYATNTWNTKERGGWLRKSAGAEHAGNSHNGGTCSG